MVRSNAERFSWVVALSFCGVALAAGCGLARDGLLDDPGGTGGVPTTTSTTTSQGGSGNTGGGTGATGATGGGGAPGCVVQDCPGEDTTCRYRTCNGECGMENAPLGTSCDEDDGEICDGEGSCLLDIGSPCTLATACLSGFCVDEVCCASACDAECESCALVGTEGTCTLVPAATDPDTECSGGVCDGAGSCATGEHLWSKRWGDGSNDSVRAVAFDSQGNVVVVGWFGGSIDFGGGALTSAGHVDVFVAKLDPDGAHLWSRRFGSTDEDAAWAVAVGPADEVVVTGWFTGTVDFGGGPRTSAGNFDVFLLTLDASGNHVRSQRFGSPWNDAGYGLAVGADGSVVLVGSFRGSIEFGGAALTTSEGRNGFVAKLSSNGAHLWSQSHGVVGSDQVAYDVALDASGNPTVVGWFWGAIDFDNQNIVSTGGSDVWALGLDAAGAYRWHRTIGGPSNDASYRVATSPSNEAVLGGEFQGTVDFGLGDVTSAGLGNDVFVVRASGADGQTLMAETYGNEADQSVFGLAVDARSNLVLGGELAGSIDFGGGPLTSAGLEDIYVAKLAVAGEHLWSKRFGDGSRQWLNHAAASAQGRIAIAGQFGGSVDFGGGPLTSAGGWDAYVAVFTP